MTADATAATPRPALDKTRSTNFCDRHDRPDAPNLGIRRVLTQSCHDLYGTKDVQDAITASYVWMADQLGHVTLGFIPTLAAGWILTLLWRWGAGDPASEPPAVFYILITVGIFAYWLYKERTDFADTKARAGTVFQFNSADIIWNVKTALLYFGIGGLLALSAFYGFWPCLIVLLLSLWPAAAVAFWWLRRKVAFQQASLPYLFRLSNFQTKLAPETVSLASKLANAENIRVWFWKTLLGMDQPQPSDPPLRHIIISGPLGTGKTCLCVGIGTEFAFALGIGRYVSATKLVETLIAQTPQDIDDMSPDDRSYEDGRIVWKLRRADLLIVDDVDAGVTPSNGVVAKQHAHLINPSTFQAVLSSTTTTPLAWLAQRRSVWVVGDTSKAIEWRDTIAAMMGLPPAAFGLIDLSEKVATVRLAAA